MGRGRHVTHRADEMDTGVSVAWVEDADLDPDDVSITETFHADEIVRIQASNDARPQSAPVDVEPPLTAEELRAIRATLPRP